MNHVSHHTNRRDLCKPVVCVFVCVCVCVGVHVCACVFLNDMYVNVYMYVYVYLYMYVCMYVCICVCCYTDLLFSPFTLNLDKSECLQQRQIIEKTLG